VKGGVGPFLEARTKIWFRLSDLYQDFFERLDLKLSGNEVYCTACYLLLILKSSCGILYYPKGFNLILFSHTISRQWRLNRMAAVSEYGTYTTVTGRFWPWLSGESHQNLSRCSLFAPARRWHVVCGPGSVTVVRPGEVA